MADLRYAGMAIYAMIFYTLLQISVAPDGENQISPQSLDHPMSHLQINEDELMEKPNPRRLRVAEDDAKEIRWIDRTSSRDLRLRLPVEDDSVREKKAGSEFHTDNRTGGERSSSPARERDRVNVIQQTSDAQSTQNKEVIRNRAIERNSSSSIACASGYKSNCQRTRSGVDKTRSQHDHGAGNLNMIARSVRGDVRRAEIGLVRKMKTLKLSASKFSNSSRTREAIISQKRNYDSSNLRKATEQYINKLAQNTRQNLGSKESISTNSQLLRDDIFWSESVEKLLLERTSEAVISRWRYDVQSQRVVRLLLGCGRGNNRLAVLENGEKLCCRYRQNIDQIQGEILSFHLARLIGIDNLPLGVLLQIEPDSEQWETVKDNITAAGWKQNRIIVATKWIPGLKPAYMPKELNGLNGTFHSEESNKFDIVDLKAKPDHLVELVQWSDLAIFDYITANLDRIVNTLVNLQWNRYMLKQPVHNLEVSPDNRLWFLDNESGLRHGYRMLPQFGHYHDQILDSVCVFRTETIEKLRTLCEEPNFWELFISEVESAEPLFQNLPSYPPKYRVLLTERMENVVKHSQQCRGKYSKHTIT